MFKRGEKPYDSLDVGITRNFKPGDTVRATCDVYWCNELQLHITTPTSILEFKKDDIYTLREWYSRDTFNIGIIVFHLETLKKFFVHL